MELRGVLGADVGSLANKVLGVLDTANKGVDARVAEAAGDDDGTANGLASRLQEHQAAIGQISHVLHGGLVVGVLFAVNEFFQREVITEFCVFH